MGKDCNQRRQRRRARRAVGQRGVATSEYALLLTVLGIPTLLGMFAGGIKMVQVYGDVRGTVLSTSP